MNRHHLNTTNGARGCGQTAAASTLDTDIEIDRAASGSILLLARSRAGQLFLRRVHGSFWNGRGCFCTGPHAADLLLLASAIGLVCEEVNSRLRCEKPNPPLADNHDFPTAEVVV